MYMDVVQILLFETQLLSVTTNYSIFSTSPSSIHPFYALYIHLYLIR